MAAEGLPIVAAALSLFTASFLLAAALLTSSRRKAYLLIGLVSSLRRWKDLLYPALPVSLVVAVFLSSLSVGDGLVRKVSDNVASNMSEVGIIVEYPDPLSPVSATLDELRSSGIVPAMVLDASGLSASASTRLTVIGGGPSITDLLPLDPDIEFPVGPSTLINKKASRELDLSAGDMIAIVLPLPHPRTLAGISSPSITVDLRISRVIPDEGLGRFRTDSRDGAGPIAVLDLYHLSELMGEDVLVNTFLCDMDLSDRDVSTAIGDALSGEDLGYSVKEYMGVSLVQNEDYMFPAPPLGDPVMSYFVDGIASENGSVPYSTLIGGDLLGTFGIETPPEGMAMISNETSERLGIMPGGTITVTARVLDGFGNLIPAEFNLIVWKVLPLERLEPLQGLVPVIEGITDQDSCSDWSPSFDIDLDRITDRDVAYWNMYRTTPRVLMNPVEAFQVFGNVHGNVSGVLINGSVDHVIGLLEDLEGGVGPQGSTAEGGGRIVRSREMALGSDRALSIFPLMFLTFGTTIIIGACLTMYGVLKGRSLKRAGEWANARAIGLGRRGLFLVSFLDSAPSLVAGAILGIPAGIMLSGLLLWMLSGAWSGSIEGYRIPFVLDARTAVFSSLAGLIISSAIVVLISIREALRYYGSDSRGGDLSIGSAGRTRWSLPIAGGAMAVLGILGIAVAGHSRSDLTTSAVFVIGSSLAASGMALMIGSTLIVVRDWGHTYLIASANIRRRPGMAPLVSCVLALVLTVAISLASVGQGLEAEMGSEAARYGGGYEHMAEIAVTHRSALDQVEERLASVGYGIAEIYAVGDEGGTCSNIHAPYPPRLLGIPPDLRFDLLRWDGKSEEDVWSRMERAENDDIPILVDENTLVWIYGGGIGSRFEVTDEGGNLIGLVVIGILAPSVLTGSFVMSVDDLVMAFPRVARPSVLLIDDPEVGGSEKHLREILAPLGPDLASTSDMGLENMEYELGFLSIFDQFLVVGIATGLVSAAAFTIARCRERSADISLLYSIGSGRRKIRRALFLENMLSFSAAVAASLTIGILGASMASVTADIGLLDMVMAPVMLAAAILTVASMVSFLGALTATSRRLLRGRDA